MSRDDDDDDRRAILARRNRFVAMAVSGLGLTASGCDDALPEPPATTTSPAPGGGSSLTPLPPSGGPAPNEAVPLPPPPPPPEEVSAMEEEDDHAPRPCLKYARPRACLSVRPRTPPPSSAPAPCLDFKPGDDDDEA